MTHTKQYTLKIISVVVALIFILGLGIDLYSPAFPAIAASLKTTNQLVQLTVSTYFLGYILGMILIGPLLDTYGRKKPLLIGLGVYTVMSILCSFSTSIAALLILRFFQGIGATVVGVGFRAILSDAFTGQKLATAMTYSSMSYRIGPIIAPMIGGYLTAYFGWQSNFYFLALYSVLLILIVALFLPETHFDHLTFRPKAILERYITTLKILPFVGGALTIGILYGMMIVFNIIAPFFIQDILHYSPIAYGHVAFIIGCFAFIGIIINRILLRKYPRESLITCGTYLILSTALLQVGICFIFSVNLYAFIVPVLLIFLFTGLINSNMISHILDLIPYGKGTASALLGIVIIACTGILTGLSSFLKSTTAVPFALAYLAMALLAFLFHHKLYRKKFKP